MYLHLGQDTVVKFDSVLGIFDMDTSTVSKFTRDFLSKAEKDANDVMEQMSAAWLNSKREP